MGRGKGGRRGRGGRGNLLQGVRGIDVPAYILNVSDLYPMHPSNILFKYAKDTYLLVPATNSSLSSHILKNISDCAIGNNLKLN